MRTKTVSYFHDMISADIFAARTYRTDDEVDALTAKLRSDCNLREEDPMAPALAECVIYTKAQRFQWTNQVPEEYRNFEEFWDMVQSGIEPKKWFEFFAAQVPYSLVIGARGGVVPKPDGKGSDFVPRVMGWQDALRTALTIWRPVEERPPEDLTDEERADPNLPSAN